MNKPDYSSTFKMKISRSLTDLQNSLDEACRLGLPPHFLNVMNNNYNEISKDYQFKNDTRDKSVVGDLGNRIANQERILTQTQFLPPKNSQFLLRNEDRESNNNSTHQIYQRELYLNVLRSLVDDRPSEKMLRRSRSYEVLNNVTSRDGFHMREPSAKNCDAGENMTKELHMLRQRLVDMDEEMTRLRSMTVEREDSAADDHPMEEMRRKLDRYKDRESELLSQLNEAILTIEEAKCEEMHAIMQSEKSKEELENMERRFKEFVEENVRKMANDGEGIEKEVQSAMGRVKEELDGVRCEIGDRMIECQTLREQLKSAHSEIDRLNMTLRSVQNDKFNSDLNLETSLTKVVMQRDETIAHNTRLQGALDKERSERQWERTTLEEEIMDLRQRISLCERSQLNLTEEKIDLVKEKDEVKYEMARLKQSLSTEKRREKEEMEKRLIIDAQKLEKLKQELCQKQLYFEGVINEADAVMRSQNMIIEKMRRELSLNVEEIDNWKERCKEENEELHWRLARTSEELESARLQLKELSETVEEGQQTVVAMRSRFGDLEGVKTKQDHEIISLLSINNSLMKSVESLQLQLREFRRRVSDCNCGVFDAGEKLINDKIIDLSFIATS